MKGKALRVSNKIGTELGITTENLESQPTRTGPRKALMKMMA